jgi:hypothetical protein
MSFISTFHEKLYRDYNLSMLGADLKEQMLQPCIIERNRGMKWYIKLSKPLLNFAIHNACYLHQHEPFKPS